MIGYVYLIGSPTFGWYKIGKSRKPEIRIENLGILLPFKIVILGVWKVQDHTITEKLLHETYINKRINGEWFEFSNKEAKLLFLSLPKEVRIFPKEGSDIFDKFSNIDEDTKGNRKVIGVKRQRKLNPNMTDEERERKRQESINQQKINKDAGLSNKGHPKINTMK